ncbi:iron ABC transporter substrate-binding protein [Streptomyces alkaliterrae]|uniref:Extracellular solute-binding protein n=1 Tax=Streptomyces alkaliterrae TaxID=2213162 RepID=A0A5P0YUF8_9ACTN|nr:iron ABC transporter substrate-binding protein [Streptomyces alkaliterrae]MBB1254900.1 iron ABC transporter substrate-binding protein [Streptomyces alkaliterrae]MBB1261415.1 iron ABC transporter substrate-binding protein [Streptomyces alkaliterrae]MQS03257.1 extracellular solute-binding protein [Streptomyces alkaliterrae]
MKSEPARRARLRTLAAVAAAAVVLPAAAACGSDNGDGGKDGKGEKNNSLVVYSGRDEALVAPLLKDLEKETGLKVEVRYGDTAELAAQILEEGDRTKAGLFFAQDGGALGALSKEGVLDKLPQKSLDKVDAKYRGGKDDWVGVSGRSRVVIYNTDKVAEKDLPKSVHELTDAKWKGKVGYAPTNASFHAFVTAMRVSEGEKKTRDWLTAFKANSPKVYEKNGAVRDGVDAGEASLGLINHYYWFEKRKEVGEDKLNSKLHFLPGSDPGALVNVAGVGVLKGGQSEAGRKAVDFLLGKDAQTYFAKETSEYPLVAGVTSPVEGLPALNTLGGPDIDLSELDSLEKTLELLKDVGMV